jgi:hypothetical protein
LWLSSGDPAWTLLRWELAPNPALDGSPLLVGAAAGGPLEPLRLQWNRPSLPSQPWMLTVDEWVVPTFDPAAAPLQVSAEIAITVRYVSLVG